MFMWPMVYIPISSFDSKLFSPVPSSASSSRCNWGSIYCLWIQSFHSKFSSFMAMTLKEKKIECSSYGFVWCFLVLRFQLEYYIKDVVSFAGPPIWRLTVPICSHWHLHRHLGDQPGIARGPSPAFPFLRKGICSSVASIPPSCAFHL